MSKKTKYTVLLMSIGLSACASLGAQQTESSLAAAQFIRKQANSPALLAKLNNLPQNKIFFQSKNGKNYYIYADAAQCQCIYVGNEAAYQRYQQIKIAQNIADEQEMAAEMNQSAALEFDAWGPWGPYY